MDSSSQETLDTIHSTGYWRVVIRPDVYEAQRIPRLLDCDEYLKDSVVRLRGWDYPHLSRESRSVGPDFVQYTTNEGYYNELSRLYQSGQFAHHFSFTEDYLGTPWEWRSRTEDDPKALSLLSTLYTFTEVLEFSVRLATKGVLGSRVQIEIEMHDLDGRKLVAGRGRYLSFDYTCTQETIRITELVSAEDLLKDAPLIARRFFGVVLHQFGWLNVGDAPFSDEQEKFLERRI